MTTNLTLKEKLMKIRGYINIPVGYLGIVLRDGQPHRFVGPGYVKCRGWNERFGPIIDIGYQAKMFLFERIRSKDGVPFQAQVRIAFTYDPRRLGNGRGLGLAYTIGERPHLLGSILEGHAERAVHRTLGRYPIKVICRGEYWKAFEQGIRRRMEQSLRPLGIQLVEQDAVILLVDPPAEIDSLLIFETMPVDVVARQKELAFWENVVNGNNTLIMSLNGGPRQQLIKKNGSPPRTIPQKRQAA